MAKDIEGLAKIGERVVLNRLNTLLDCLTHRICIRAGNYLPERQKKEVKEAFESYKKERDGAVKLGLDISSYEIELLELSKRYSQITGERL